VRERQAWKRDVRVGRRGEVLWRDGGGERETAQVALRDSLSRGKKVSGRLKKKRGEE